jgi:E3 ubiquitin-protein ligase HUWE1
LLNTTDIDILEAVLRLMLRPAQRVNNPKAVQSSFLAHQDKVTELARGGSITDLSSTETTMGNNRICMSFFRTSRQEENKEEKEEEGLHAININVVPNQYTDRVLFWKLVEEHHVPKENHFELLNRVRIANHMTEIAVRRQLLIIRFISIVIMGKYIFTKKDKYMTTNNSKKKKKSTHHV